MEKKKRKRKEKRKLEDVIFRKNHKASLGHFSERHHSRLPFTTGLGNWTNQLDIPCFLAT